MDETARSCDEPEPPPAQAARLHVDVTDATRRLSDADRLWLSARAQAAADELASRHKLSGEVRVMILDDSRMSAAHDKYSNDPSTTDVLTFDLTEDGVTDVDISICLDEAERHAARLNHEPRRELLLYVIHGILHCLGHDDHDDASYEAMHKAEDELLESIGVGRTFDRETPAGVEPANDGGAA